MVTALLHFIEDEAEITGKFFGRYIHTNNDVIGVAQHLNEQGYQKKVNQNGWLGRFTGSFADRVLYNPVYMSKIAGTELFSCKTVPW